MRKRNLIGLGVLPLLTGLGLPAAAQTAPQSANEVSDVDTVIVTGTREVGRRQYDSPTPIEVISNETLEATGATNVFDALKDVVPSFSSTAFGQDTGALVRSVRLRGLNPGQVLVLVNGKRRHASANINADSDPDQGSNPVDLDTIPLSAIDHVEVLQDGAAAQYGSDAIAGVVNIILKSSDHGTNVEVTGGITGRGDGATGQADTDTGVALPNGGFLHLSADGRLHDFTNRTGYDPRSNYTIQGRTFGDPAYNLETVGFNGEIPLGDTVTAYGFGTFAHRYVEAYENWRTPTKVPQIWPNGFFPEETSDENDFGFTVGVKGSNLLDWSWDLSSTFGRDAIRLGVIDSANPTLFYTTGDSQTNFHAGDLTNIEATTNLDIRREFEQVLPHPLNVAFGLEHRYESYEVDAGEPASYVLGGSQGYAGFTPTDAHDADRNVYSAYVDLSTHILPPWQIDLSGRVEKYDDVGSTETGKVSTRYDFFKWLGLRGSFGNSFRAPTLAQEYFSATNVTPTSAFVQLPVNSPGAALLGAPALKPEKSTNYSVGLVSEPIDRLHASIDAYRIDITDRIIDSGTIFGPQAVAAITANGATIPSGVSTSAVSALFFANGANTSTRGIDLAADYTTDFGSFGAVKWGFAGNTNQTEITKQYQAPGALAAKGISLFSPATVANLTTVAPRNKFSLSGTYLYDNWDITLRETRWGHSSLVYDQYGDGTSWVTSYVAPAFTTDLDIGYQLTKNLKVSIGGQNVFDVYPAKTNPAIRRFGINTNVYPWNSPYGYDGGYYYGRVKVTF